MMDENGVAIISRTTTTTNLTSTSTTSTSTITAAVAVAGAAAAAATTTMKMTTLMSTTTTMRTTANGCVIGFVVTVAPPPSHSSGLAATIGSTIRSSICSKSSVSSLLDA